MLVEKFNQLMIGILFVAVAGLAVMFLWLNGQVNNNWHGHTSDVIQVVQHEVQAEHELQVQIDELKAQCAK